MSLEETFGMETEEYVSDDDITVQIPDDPDKQNFELMIKLALKAYEDLMNTASETPPKDRLKIYEMAERYLNQAKDARAKMEKANLDREKAAKSLKKPSESDTEATQEENPQEQGVSRRELSQKLREVK